MNQNFVFTFPFSIPFPGYCGLAFRDDSTSLVISSLGSLGVYQKAVYFYCCVVNVSFVKVNFMIYEFDE